MLYLSRGKLQQVVQQLQYKDSEVKKEHSFLFMFIVSA